MKMLEMPEYALYEIHESGTHHIWSSYPHNSLLGGRLKSLYWYSGQFLSYFLSEIGTYVTKGRICQFFLKIMFKLDIQTVW